MSGARVEQLRRRRAGTSAGAAAAGAGGAAAGVDLLIALGLRGLLRTCVGRRGGAAAAALAQARHAQALETGLHPALATRLAYIVTGDAQVDGMSKAGLEGLSEYVNRRTAATLVEPDPVEPGKTDLSFYPLLYWPITADAQPLPPRRPPR